MSVFWEHSLEGRRGKQVLFQLRLGPEGIIRVVVKLWEGGNVDRERRMIFDDLMKFSAALLVMYLFCAR